MQFAGGGKGSIAKLFGCGNGEDDVVRRESLRHVDEVYSNAG